MNGAYLYILQCADGSYYVGTARRSLEARLAEHNSGALGGYTSTRRPVSLVYSQHHELIADAIAVERQVKGWPRGKKQALIAGNWARIQELLRRREPHPSRRPAAPGSSG